MSQGESRGGRGEEVSSPRSSGGIQPCSHPGIQTSSLQSSDKVCGLKPPVLSALVWQSQGINKEQLLALFWKMPYLLELNWEYNTWVEDKLNYVFLLYYLFWLPGSSRFDGYPEGQTLHSRISLPEPE